MEDEMGKPLSPYVVNECFRMSSLRRASFLVLLEKVVLTLAGISVSVILARTLGPAGLGDWKLLMSAQNISMYILGLGLTLVVMRYTAEFVKDQRFDAVADLFFGTLTITLVVITITGALYFLFVETFGSKIETALFSPGMAILIFCMLSINLLNDIVGRAFFTGLKRRDIVAIVQMIGRGFFFVMVLILWVSGLMTLESAIVLLVGAYSIELGLYGVLLSKRRKVLFRRGRGISLTSEEGRRIVGFAGFQWLFRMAHLFREYSVDNYMLLVFSGVGSVGIYGAAVTMPVLIRWFSPAKMFGGILIPNLVPKREHINNSAKERLIFYYRFIQKVTAIAVWPVAVLGIAFAHDIIVGIFGESFIEGVPAMQILSAFMFVHTANDIFYNLAVVLEESRLMFLTALWGIANMGINFALIPIWGVIGAAIGTGVVSIGIYAHLRIAFARKGWVFAYPWKGCWKVAAALMPLCVVLIGDMMIIPSLGYKLLAVAIGLIFYLGLIRRYSPFDMDEKNFIIDRFGRPAMLLVRQEARTQ